MKNIIALWSGAIVDIPPSWHLCDGSAGTPDLRNRFIVGAGDTYDPGNTGGNDAQTHDFTGDGHTHSLAAGAAISAGADRYDNTTSVPAAGTTDSSDNRPSYYALAWIMKL